MLRIVLFDNGRYGLQNTWTGIILPKTFRSSKAAERKAYKLTKKLNRTIASLK